MSLGSAIGELFVKITPDLSTFASDLEKGTAEGASRMGRNVQKGSRVALGAIVGVGAGLIKMGGEWDDVSDNIRIATGATGDELKGLEDIVKNIGVNTPNDFASIGEAVTGVNQVLGLTGPELEERATQFAELSRITGEDLAGALDSVSGVFNQFGTSVEDQGPMLDSFFRISQSTGVGVTELAEGVRKNGAVLEQFGLSTEESAALIGQLGKSGIDAQKIMPGLTRVLKDAGEAGIPAEQALGDLQNRITGAATESEATAIAIEAFGQRAGPLLAKQMREGSLSFEDFSAIIGDGSDTIANAEKDTGDWGEKLTELKNQVFVALQPAAEKLFSNLGKSIGSVGPAIVILIGALTPILELFAGLPAPIQATVLGVLSVGAVFTKVTGPIVSMIGTFQKLATVMMANPWVLLVTAIAAAVAGVIYAYQHFEGFRNLVDSIGRWFRDELWPIMQDVFNWLAENVPPILQSIADFFTDVVIPAIESLVQWINDNLVPAFQAIARFIKDEVIPVVQTMVQWFTDNVLPIFVAVAKFIAEKLVPAFASIVSFIVDKVIPTWIKIHTTMAEVVLKVAGYIDNIVSFVTGIPGRIGSTIDGLWDGLKNGITGAKDWVKNRIDDVVDFATALPGRLSGLFSGMWNGIKEAFRSAINGAIRLWNRLEFRVPSVSVFGKELGGFTIGTPDIPEMHTGGIVPGTRGSETIATLQAGEGVFTREQMAALGNVGSLNIGQLIVGDRRDLPETRATLDRVLWESRFK